MIADVAGSPVATPLVVLGVFGAALAGLFALSALIVPSRGGSPAGRTDWFASVPPGGDSQRIQPTQNRHQVARLDIHRRASRHNHHQVASSMRATRSTTTSGRPKISLPSHRTTR